VLRWLEHNVMQWPDSCVGAMNSIILFVSDAALIHKQRPVAYIGMVIPDNSYTDHCIALLRLRWVLQATHAQSLKS